MSKYQHLTSDWIDAVIDKLGGEEVAERFLRDEFKMVERLTTRRVRVNYTRTLYDAIAAAGFRPADDSTRSNIAAIPCGKGDEGVEVVFFLAPPDLHGAEAEEVYDVRDFVSADPFVVAAVHEAESNFIRKYDDTCTYWRVNGLLYMIRFMSGDDGTDLGRRVSMQQVSNEIWCGQPWLAGIHK